MALQEALALFRRLGVYPEMMSRSEFSAAYYRLATLPPGLEPEDIRVDGQHQRRPNCDPAVVSPSKLKTWGPGARGKLGSGTSIRVEPAGTSCATTKST
jgi:hypothetical protein